MSINNSNSASGSERYAQLFQGSEAVARYQRKLNNRIDVLRDEVEIQILSRVLKGSVFDCTVGIGRFIGRLPNVTSYDGMDLSSEFVEYVKQVHPDGMLFTSDLTKSIPLESATYDNLICLRSLSGIGQLATILPEMLRVVRPGGLLVIDYGRKATMSHVKGVMSVIDGDDLEGALKNLDADVVERIHVDAALTRAKIYGRIFSFLTGPRGKMVSDATLLQAEHLTAPLLWQRQIIVLKRR